jgi:hypothetical protein
MRGSGLGGKRGQTIALGAVLLLCSAACGEREDRQERVLQRSQSLEAQVAPERDVEAYPELRHVPGRAVVSCGTLRCIAFYSVDPYVYANRIDKTGQIVDTPPTLLGRGAEPIAAGARGDEFVVIWGASGDRRATRLQGSNGQITGDFTQNLPDSDIYRLESTGNSWLLVYRESADPKAVVKSATSFATVGAPVSLSGAGYWPAVIPGAGQYLVAQNTGAWRISETSGAAFDAAPIVFSRYDEPFSAVTGAHKDGIYVLSWASNQKVYATRIRASDGVRLDPDDDFNQISGAKLVASGQSSTSTGFANALDDSVLLSWSGFGSTGVELWGARVDVATLSRLSGPVTSPELIIGSGSFDQLQLRSDWGMAVQTHTIIPLEVRQAPFQLTSQSEAGPIRSAALGRSKPQVASNGSNYLVVWEIANWGTSSTSIRGTRVDATTGAYLDDPPLALGQGADPVVAANGSSYLVAWRAPNFTNVERRVVSSTGQVGPLLTGIVGSNTGGDSFVLTSNNRYYFFSHLQYNRIASQYQMMGTRISADGSLVDSELFLLGPVSAFRFETIGDTAPAENMRTFVTFYDNLSLLKARRVRSETAAVIEPETDVGNSGFERAATDGTRAFVVFRNGATQTFRANLVDPVTGLIQNANPVTLGDLRDESFNEVPFVDAWYDGKSYLAAFDTRGEVGKRVFSLRRWGTDLQPLDSALPGAGTPVVSDFEYSLTSGTAAGAGNGRSLFVYVRHDPARLSPAIKLRLIANDGLPAAGTGGTGGTAGTGGTGGTAGTAGTGGTGGTAGTAGTGGTGGTGTGGTGGTGGTAGNGGTGGTGGTAGVGGVAGTAADASTDGSGGVTADGSAGSAGSDGSVGQGGAEGGTGGGTSDASSESAAGVAGAGGSSAGRDAGAPAPPGAPSDDGGCGCRYPASTNDGRANLMLAAALAIGMLRRRISLARARSKAAATCDPE